MVYIHLSDVRSPLLKTAPAPITKKKQVFIYSTKHYVYACTDRHFPEFRNRL